MIRVPVRAVRVKTDYNLRPDRSNYADNVGSRLLKVRQMQFLIFIRQEENVGIVQPEETHRSSQFRLAQLWKLGDGAEVRGVAAFSSGAAQNTDARALAHIFGHRTGKKCFIVGVSPANQKTTSHT
jgi:hypothetical protein